MTRLQRRALAAGTLAALVLAGCAGPSTPAQQASAAQKASCRQRANEVYAKQNRGDLYRADSYQTDTRDSPFGTSGLPGITSRGLSGEYARQNLISDCLNDAAGNVGDSGADAPPASSAPATPGKLPRSFSPLAVPPAATP